MTRPYNWPGEGHPPGAHEAVQAGCDCPILDNARGHGAGGYWWIGSDCKLHAGKDAPWGDPRFPWKEEAPPAQGETETP